MKKFLKLQKSHSRQNSAKLKLLCIILLFTTLLSAETKVEQDTLKTRKYQLEGIRIIADRPQQSIGSIETREFNPVYIMPQLNISETLENVSGLTLSNGGKGGTELNIRGFRNEQIKILLDGRPLGGGYFDNVDLNTIPVSEIKEVRIIKGPVSALYGSDTMGGVVNIITRSAADNSWLKAGLLARRNNTNKIYLSSSHSFDGWDYWLYASRYHSDGFVLSEDFRPTAFENGAVRNNTARQQWDFQSKINFSLFDFHSVGFQAGYTFMDKKEIPSSIYEERLREFLDWERMQLSGVAFFQLTDFVTADVNVYYDQYDDTYAEFDADTGVMYSTWPSYLESWIFGVNNKLDWQINSFLKATGGNSYEKEVYNRKDNGSYKVWTSNNQHKHNGFLQTELNWHKFTFSTGLGVSFFRQKDRKDWIHHIEPSAGIYWKNGFRASLAYSANTKYPSLHELFSSSSGNPDLVEEQADKLELAIEQPFILNSLYGSVKQVLFYNRVNGLIDKVNSRYENLEELKSYGFETELKLKYIIEHQIAYSFLRYTDDSQVGLLNVPRNSISIIENFEIPWQVKLKYEADWNDIRFVQEDNENKYLPSYWLHSVYFHKKWDRYKFMLGLENIFDENYQGQYGYPAEGFNFVVSVEAEF